MLKSTLPLEISIIHGIERLDFNGLHADYRGEKSGAQIRTHNGKLMIVKIVPIKTL